MRSQAASVTLGMRWIKGRRIGMASWPRRRGEVRWRADMDPVIDAEGRSCQQKHQGQNPLGFVEPCKDHTAISVAIATCLSCSYQEQVQHHPSIGPHVHRQHTFPHIAARGISRLSFARTSTISARRKSSQYLWEPQARSTLPTVSTGSETASLQWMRGMLCKLTTLSQRLPSHGSRLLVLPLG